MYSSVALKSGGPCTFGPHCQKVRSSGPQDPHRIAATAHHQLRLSTFNPLLYQHQRLVPFRHTARQMFVLTIPVTPTRKCGQAASAASSRHQLLPTNVERTPWLAICDRKQEHKVVGDGRSAETRAAVYLCV